MYPRRQASASSRSSTWISGWLFVYVRNGVFFNGSDQRDTIFESDSNLLMYIYFFKSSRPRISKMVLDGPILAALLLYFFDNGSISLASIHDPLDTHTYIYTQRDLERSPMPDPWIISCSSTARYSPKLNGQTICSSSVKVPIRRIIRQRTRVCSDWFFFFPAAKRNPFPARDNRKGEREKNSKRFDRWRLSMDEYETGSFVRNITIIDTMIKS